MKPKQTTLVMAGAREAHALTTALLDRGRQVVASLPEPERMFGALPVPTRVGGFATPQVLDDWLLENNVGAVIDASHPFDNHLGEQVGGLCSKNSLGYLRLLRPPWHETTRDIWYHVQTIQKAANAVPDQAVVFTNTGWLTLAEYKQFAGKKLFMRQTRLTDKTPPFCFVEFIEGTPPFSQFQEQALFERYGITHLICRNVGGAASMSKLLAARALQIPVFMVGRAPIAGHCAVVETVAEALDWEAGL